MSESDDLRQLLREFLLRFDRRMDQHDEELRIQRKELRIIREENRAYFERLREDTAEILAEGRAQREALFRMLDRLDGGGAAPAG